MSQLPSTCQEFSRWRPTLYQPTLKNIFLIKLHTKKTIILTTNSNVVELYIDTIPSFPHSPHYSYQTANIHPDKESYICPHYSIYRHTQCPNMSYIINPIDTYTQWATSKTTTKQETDLNNDANVLDYRINRRDKTWLTYLKLHNFLVEIQGRGFLMLQFVTNSQGE